MITIRKNENDKKRITYTATVRIPKDYCKPVKQYSITRTHDTKSDAKAWAQRIASSIKLELWEDPRLVENRFGEIPTLHDALDRYLESETPKKKGADRESTMIQRWKRHPLAKKLLHEISKSHIAEYRDERLKAGRANSTVRNEINLISSLYHVAQHDWAFDVPNPVAELRKRRGAIPRPAAGRERRLKEGEYESLTQSLGEGKRGNEMVALFIIATETGMRLGEILSLKREWFTSPDVIQLPSDNTKTSEYRSVLLSKKAVNALANLPLRIDKKVFSLNVVQVENAWRYACKKCSITNLRFHDMRHEALSRMAAAGGNLKEMMMQSGHSTPEMLMRYVNPSEQDRRALIRKMEAEN